jgi:purine-binding chemotaxis protein CheW
MQYLTFTLNCVEYAVDVRIVETVIEYSTLTQVPSPLPYMKGVIDLRGQVIPVIDLRKKFGIPARHSDEGTSIIVISVKSEDGSMLIGAIVDNVSEVVQIEESALESSGDHGNALWERYVKGIIRQENRMLVAIAPDGMFSFDEFSALTAAQKIE